MVTLSQARDPFSILPTEMWLLIFDWWASDPGWVIKFPRVRQVCKSWWKLFDKNKTRFTLLGKASIDLDRATTRVCRIYVECFWCGSHSSCICDSEFVTDTPETILVSLGRLRRTIDNEDSTAQRSDVLLQQWSKFPPGFQTEEMVKLAFPLPGFGLRLLPRVRPDLLTVDLLRDLIVLTPKFTHGTEIPVGTYSPLKELPPDLHTSQIHILLLSLCPINRKVPPGYPKWSDSEKRAHSEMLHLSALIDCFKQPSPKVLSYLWKNFPAMTSTKLYLDYFFRRHPSQYATHSFMEQAWERAETASSISFPQKAKKILYPNCLIQSLIRRPIQSDDSDGPWVDPVKNTRCWVHQETPNEGFYMTAWFPPWSFTEKQRCFDVLPPKAKPQFPDYPITRRHSFLLPQHEPIAKQNYAKVVGSLRFEDDRFYFMESPAILMMYHKDALTKSPLSVEQTTPYPTLTAGTSGGQTYYPTESQTLWVFTCFCYFGSGFLQDFPSVTGIYIKLDKGDKLPPSPDGPRFVDCRAGTTGYKWLCSLFRRDEWWSISFAIFPGAEELFDKQNNHV